MSDIDIDELRAWARECGDIALRLFNRVEVHRKADRSPVTEADTTIERLLVERITARYPHHGIIGEEQARRDTTREFVWAIDPIDGTASFVAGLPIWGVSIGLLRHGLPYAGLVYLPVVDEYYWAVHGGAAYLGDRPIMVVAPPEWDSEDWLATPSNAHRALEIDFSGKTRSLGSAAASVCYVARGTAVGAVLTQSSIWDLAGGLAILSAAGGVAVNLAGAALDTRLMLDGQAVREPILFGAPTVVDRLRSCIWPR